jgi:hypothetical protein
VKFLLQSSEWTLDSASPSTPGNADEQWECLTLEEFVHYLSDTKIEITIPSGLKNYDAVLKILEVK